MILKEEMSRQADEIQELKLELAKMTANLRKELPEPSQIRRLLKEIIGRNCKIR